MAIEHAKQRETFGELLSRRQAIQWMLADAEVELRATRLLIWDGAWKADRGEDARVEASIAKLYSSEVLGRVIDNAVQIHGGYGVSKEFPLERWYREARVRRIGEGPSEVHRMVMRGPYCVSTEPCSHRETSERCALLGRAPPRSPQIRPYTDAALYSDSPLSWRPAPWGSLSSHSHRISERSLLRRRSSAYFNNIS